MLEHHWVCGAASRRRSRRPPRPRRVRHPRREPAKHRSGWRVDALIQHGDAEHNILVLVGVDHKGHRDDSLAVSPNELRIVWEADAAVVVGEEDAVGGLLRWDGLSSSELATWWRERARARGDPPVDDQAHQAEVVGHGSPGAAGARRCDLRSRPSARSREPYLPEPMVDSSRRRARGLLRLNLSSHRCTYMLCSITSGSESKLLCFLAGSAWPSKL